MCSEESSVWPWVSLKEPRARLREAVGGPAGVVVRPVTTQEVRPPSARRGGGGGEGRTG